MSVEKRVKILTEWRESLIHEEWLPDQKLIEASNPWFTSNNIQLALGGVQRLLDPDKMTSLASNYLFKSAVPKTVGIIPAANLPMVGFHDLLCVLLSGHQAVIKLSRRDQLLLPAMCQLLSKIDTQMGALVDFVSEFPSPPEGLIASGGDNTARFLNYHFPDVPRIIRKNRTSHAILKTNESTESLAQLGLDTFSYFGKGCRNISKFWVPVGYDLESFKVVNQQFQSHMEVIPYANNYRHHKAILNTTEQSYLDLGFALMQENPGIVSPIAVIYYQHYRKVEEVSLILAQSSSKIQCLVSREGWFPDSLPFGRSQYPEIWDFADKVDTLDFLSNLN